MKNQFKKGKGDDNVWYFIIFGNADVLRKFANVWKRIRAKIEELVALYSMIKIT